MAVVSNGTTIIDAGALGSGVATGKMTLIKTLTASSSANLSFVDGAASVVLDDTYDSYVFKFINIHPATDSADIMMNFSVDSGSNYNVTKTSSQFRAYHDEADSATSLAYEPSGDMAQGTGDLNILFNIGNGNDECGAGTLTIYNPSDTTFVKHFIATMQRYDGANYSVNQFTAGYGNTQSAVDSIRFQMDSGNIDSGVIKLYGIGG